MKNTGTQILKAALTQASYKVTPYPCAFSVEQIMARRNKWDYTTNLASVLYEDFKQRPGFANKSSTAMISDELATTIMPHESIKDVEFLNNQTVFQMNDQYWIKKLKEIEVWGENWEKRKSVYSIYTGFKKLGKDKKDYWRLYRANEVANVLQKITGGEVINFEQELSVLSSLSAGDRKHSTEILTRLIRGKRLPGVGSEESFR